MYTSAAALKPLLSWLHPKGCREGPLRVAIAKACEVMASTSALPHQGPGSKFEVGVNIESGETEPVPGILAPSSLPKACFAPVAGSKGGSRSGGPKNGTSAHQEPAPTSCASTVAAATKEAEDLRSELLALHKSLPAAAFKSQGAAFWGSEERQAAWREFVAHCPPTPQHLAAGLTLLEHMVADEALKPVWQLWGCPTQNPTAVTSFATVWYRWVPGGGGWQWGC